MIKVQLSGLDELRAGLTEFSDRRFSAAVATALSRTAVQVKDQLRGEMPNVFNRPTPYTLNSLRTKSATADKLAATVDFKDDLGTSGGGIPATNYLQPHVSGGGRRTKRLEVALRAAGALPPGYFAVPGVGARMDAYGNVDRGQIIQVLSQLRIQLLAGSQRNMSFDPRKAIAAQRKAGGRFFVVPPGEGRQAGVYQREFFGRNVTPVFVFVKSVAYRQTWDFSAMAERMVGGILPDQLDRSISEHMARLAAK